MPPAWLAHGRTFFVHGGFHPAMLHQAPPPPLGRVDPVLSRALFGETTGRMQPDVRLPLCELTLASQQKLEATLRSLDLLK